MYYGRDVENHFQTIPHPNSQGENSLKKKTIVKDFPHYQQNCCWTNAISNPMTFSPRHPCILKLWTWTTWMNELVLCRQSIRIRIQRDFLQTKTLVIYIPSQPIYLWYTFCICVGSINGGCRYNKAVKRVSVYLGNTYYTGILFLRTLGVSQSKKLRNFFFSVERVGRGSSTMYRSVQWRGII